MDFTDSESQSEQNDVPVPNVVGKLEKDASSTLSAAGFKVSKTYKYDDSVDAGGFAEGWLKSCSERRIQ